ncbi:MAG TPA: DUF998 domain-containing protein [Thermoplasmata archaeon]|nr:DUF998 domain-containing protein [Thermoplasmata archaeon]
MSSGRPSAAIGVASGAAFLILYTLAAVSDPGYSFMENYLSDLGVGPGALAFNAALVSTGSLIALFAVFGLLPAFERRDFVVSVGVGMLALSGVLLVFVGIFTEDSGNIHTFFSYAFFLTMLFTIGVISLALHRERAIGVFGLIVSDSTFAMGVALMFAGFTPAAETVAVLLLLSWGVILSGALYLRSRGFRIP